MLRKKLFSFFLIFVIPIILVGIILVVENKEKNRNEKQDGSSSQSDGNNALAVTKSNFFNVWITPDTNPIFIPWRDWNVEEPKIEAKAAILMEVKKKPNNLTEEKILFQENIYKPLPIASLTKIMTAIVVMENLDLSKNVKISKEAVSQEGEAGSLVVGEELPVKTLLYAMLMESSNDAAFVLASEVGIDNFVELMNRKAKSIQLENTSFANPIGLDDPKNFSTAHDFAKLLEYSFDNQLLWEILKTQSFETTDILGKFPHNWKNTNKLLDVLPNIAGGKTGLTQAAGGCVALVVNNPENESKIISVMLGAPDENKRFEETKKILDWVFKAYKW